MCVWEGCRALRNVCRGSGGEDSNCLCSDAVQVGAAGSLNVECLC